MNGRPSLLNLASQRHFFWDAYFLGLAAQPLQAGTDPLQVQVMPGAVRAPRANPTIWRAAALNFVAHVGAALRVAFL
jgi:hypothetical protein